MKSITSLLGIILIVLGITTFVYQGITYTKKEQIAQIGDVEVSANTQKTVYFPPIFGGAAIVVGLVLVIVSKRK